MIDVGDNQFSEDMDNTYRDGWFNVDSVLQGAKDALGKYPPSEGSKQVINALTGLKSGTRPVIAIFKEATQGMVGDSSRDSLNEKVIDPNYIAGFYFSYFTWNTPNVNYVLTEDEAIQDFLASADAGNPAGAPHSFVSYNSGPPVYPTNINAPFVYQDSATNQFGSTISALSCAVTPGTLSVCPVLAPVVLWADLGATQLAWTTALSAAIAPFTYAMTGKFNPHPYDFNVPTLYEDGASILDLANNIANTVRIGPLSAGGWYVYYSDAITGLPAGAVTDASVLKINANRTHGGFMTPNQLATRLPPTS